MARANPNQIVVGRFVRTRSVQYDQHRRATIGCRMPDAGGRMLRASTAPVS